MEIVGIIIGQVLVGILGDWYVGLQDVLADEVDED